MLKLAHIVNPVAASPGSDLYRAQPFTFETMRRAQAYAQPHVDVELLAAQYLEDRPVIPRGFRLTPDLTRSVCDLSSFSEKRKLPLIADILGRLHEATNADYLIYTNVDIALMPFFYVTVATLISYGYDAFSITRRTVPVLREGIGEIPLMYALAGIPHPGHDCFIFNRDAFPSYYLADACLGADHVGKILLLNLRLNACRFAVFNDLHATFHIGDERRWSDARFQDYEQHNRLQLQRVVNHYARQGQLPDDSLAHRYWAVAKGGPWATLERLVGHRGNYVLAFLYRLLSRVPEKSEWNEVK